MKRLRLVLLLSLFGLGEKAFAQASGAFEERLDFSIPKTIYFTGEKIWLSIDVTTDSGPTPSRIVYAELWNRHNESVALAKIPIQEDGTVNYLEIPDKLPSDHYLLRVFTRVSPEQNPEKGLVQEFVTVFNPHIPPKVVADRLRLDATTDSPLLQLSTKRAFSGDSITVGYTGADSLMELSVAFSNPFLQLLGKQSTEVLYEDLLSRKSVPEFFGHIIEAKVARDRSDSLGSNLFYLSLHGSESVLLTDKSDEEGRLFFDAGGLRHWDFMVAQGGENQAMGTFEIVSPSPQTRFRSDFEFPLLHISPGDESLLRDLLRGSQIDGYFVQEFQETPIPVVTGFVQDRSFALDAYNRFENVETHIREYVPEVLVRSRDRHKELRVLNALENRSFAESPLILVDAMPIFDTDALLKFNPAKFERMEVLTRPFFLNDGIYAGVVSFTSFQGDFGGFPLPANAVYIPYSGIISPVVEYSRLFEPTHENAALPDWRTILHWSKTVDDCAPEKITSVTTSMAKGTFLVTVKTKDSAGKTNYEYAQFEVK